MDCGALQNGNRQQGVCCRLSGIPLETLDKIDYVVACYQDTLFHRIKVNKAADRFDKCSLCEYEIGLRSIGRTSSAKDLASAQLTPECL